MYGTTANVCWRRAPRALSSARRSSKARRLATPVRLSLHACAVSVAVMRWTYASSASWLRWTGSHDRILLVNAFLARFVCWAYA